MGHVLREVSCYGIITTGVKNIKLNRPSTTPAHYKVIPAVSLHSHVAATVGSSTMGSRKSERSKNMPVSLNPRIQSLFHHVEGEEPKFHRRLEKIHTNPAIYLVRNFLSDVDLDYLDRNITQHASKFKASYTEDESGKKCVSDERTSTYIFLDKGRDATIRNLEMRASGKFEEYMVVCNLVEMIAIVHPLGA